MESTRLVGGVAVVNSGNRAGRKCAPAESNRPHSSRQLEVTEKILERLGEGTQSGMILALRDVAQVLKGSGGEVALMTEFGQPNLLFRWGELEQIADVPEIYDFYTGLWGRSEVVGQCLSIRLRSNPWFACCALVRSEGEILGVDVWGHSAQNVEDLTMLRIFLRALNSSIPYAREFGKPEKSVPAQNSPKTFPAGYFVGQSKASTLLHREVETICSSNLPVLLVGETGVGKEHLAHLLHLWSSRADGPFVAINCAAIPAELLEAEMFGIARGVATGVIERAGYFQRAQGGTLFLDEIGEMSRHLQAKLLRAIQEKEVSRVGGETVKVDVRIVTATNSDLQKRLEEGGFRADLYYRIAGAVIRVPPLRERKEDIQLLVQHFIDISAGESGKFIRGITIWALELLTQYHWPGNVRELQHEVRRLVSLCPDGQSINSALISEPISAPEPSTADSNLSLENTLLIEPHVAELERTLIRNALKRSGGNQTIAAKLLGISRNGLAIRMARRSIQVSRSVVLDQ